MNCSEKLPLAVQVNVRITAGVPLAVAASAVTVLVLTVAVADSELGLTGSLLCVITASASRIQQRNG